MDINKYIASGILELYVAGLLSEKENKEVHSIINKHPEVKQEVENIENAIVKLAAKNSLTDTATSLQNIKNKMQGGSSGKVISINSNKNSWIKYTGWAAAIIVSGGLLWTLNQNRELTYEIQSVEVKNAVLEQQIFEANNDLNKAQELVSILRDKNITTVELGGQTVAPTAYAKVYWKKEDNTVYIDAQGLPDPPKGMVYQVWSLKLEPLTPTSIGLLSDFISDDNKVFTLSNPNNSQAFGITLEPDGGSKTPTMEQLYTLGVVQS